MRHGKKFNHLSRTASHRRAMLANMAISLIMHKRITTTLPKAKALKKYVEPLLTKSKRSLLTEADFQNAADPRAEVKRANDNAHRVVFSYLHNKEAIKELFGVVAPAIADRQGGYTRIIHLGFRQSDGADIAFIELVDFDDNMKKAEKKAKRTRRGRGKTAPAAEAAATAAEETAPASEENAAPADEETKAAE